MADRELIAAVLTAGLLPPAQKGREGEAIEDAIILYEQVIAALRRRFPTEKERLARHNVEVFRRMDSLDKEKP